MGYLRARSGKSARLTGKDFDRAAANDVSVAEEEAPAEAAPAEEAKAEEPAEETPAAE